MEKQMASAYVRLPTGEFSPLFAFFVNFYIIFDATTYSIIIVLCTKFVYSTIKSTLKALTIGQKFSISLLYVDPENSRNISQNSYL